MLHKSQRKNKSPGTWHWCLSWQLSLCVTHHGPEPADLKAMPKQGWSHTQVSDVCVCAGAPVCYVRPYSQACVCCSKQSWLLAQGSWQHIIFWEQITQGWIWSESPIFCSVHNGIWQIKRWKNTAGKKYTALTVRYGAITCNLCLFCKRPLPVLSQSWSSELLCLLPTWSIQTVLVPPWFWLFDLI